MRVKETSESAVGDGRSQPASALTASLIARYYYPVGHVDLFITERCNLRCPYCFVEGKKARDIKLETAFKAIDFILKHSAEGASIGILFFGGEPFIRFDLMRSITLYGVATAQRAGRSFYFTVTTNGTLLNEEKLAFCRDYGIKFLLSVDGGPESHNRNRKFADGRGSFDTIAARIPLMKRYQPWLGARVTPTPETVGRLCEDVVNLFGLGINQFIVGPATGVDWPAEAIGEYTEQMKRLVEVYADYQAKRYPFRLTQFEDDLEENEKSKRFIWGCGAGRGRISVNVDGEIQGCGKIQGLNELKGNLPFGNVDTGFTLEGLKNRALLCVDGLRWREDCARCECSDECAGGCPATNFGCRGSIYLPNPQECEFVRRRRETKEHLRMLKGEKCDATVPATSAS